MSKSLVIAHVLSSFGLGGQEHVALELARLQTRAGHTVHAISLGSLPEGPGADAFRSAGVSVTTIPKRGRLDVLLPLRVARYLRRVRASVVHTHNPHALIYGAPAGRLAGAVVIHSKHGMNPDRPRRLLLRRAAARLADAYVAVAPALGAVAVAGRDCDAGKLSVIANGIDAGRFMPSGRARREVRAALGIPADAWVVGTVGRLSPEKDQAFLIDAMAPLLGERRHLLIVGDGPTRGALQSRIERLPGRRYVHMTGARADVERLLASFDAFALTSRTEGLPLVLLEAMATALPVVSTAVGGIPDLVENQVTGFLSPVGDRAELTRLLERLSTDEALSRRMGEAGREHVLQRYSASHMAAEYESLYVRMLERRGRVDEELVAVVGS
jgi:glycosyltransferase involved in cell wall biosynthesis